MDGDGILPPDSIPKDGDDTPAKWAPGALPPGEMKKRVTLVMALKAQGLSRNEIMEKTGLTRNQIGWAMQKAYEQGIIEAQLQHRLNNIALPLAVDQLIEILSNDEHARHYDAVRDTLYGRGEFRNHSHSISDNRNLNLNLTVEYEMPGGAPLPTVVQVTEATGLMTGTPREDQADADSSPRY